MKLKNHCSSEFAVLQAFLCPRDFRIYKLCLVQILNKFKNNNSFPAVSNQNEKLSAPIFYPKIHKNDFSAFFEITNL